MRFARAIRGPRWHPVDCQLHFSQQFEQLADRAVHTILLSRCRELQQELIESPLVQTVVAEAQTSGKPLNDRAARDGPAVGEQYGAARAALDRRQTRKGPSTPARWRRDADVPGRVAQQSPASCAQIPEHDVL